MSADIALHRFEIPGADGYPLRGDLRFDPARATAAAVVISHGYKGFKDWGFFPLLAEELARAGYLALSFNYSGSGIGEDPEIFSEIERFERSTLSDDLYDLGAVLDALLGGGLPGPAPDGRVALLGHSRGAGIALVRATEDRRVGCLIGWAGVGTFDRFDAEQIRLWRERGWTEILNSRTGQTFRVGTDLLDDLERHRLRYDLVRAVRQLTVPYLIVHGADDETVPLREVEELRTWAPPRSTRLEVVPDTGHTFGAVHPFAGRTAGLERALAVTLDHLREYLPA